MICEQLSFHKNGSTRVTSCLTVEELAAAETYWLLISQQDHFANEIVLLRRSTLYPVPVVYCLCILFLTLQAYFVLVAENRIQMHHTRANIPLFYTVNILWQDSSSDLNICNYFMLVLNFSLVLSVIVFISSDTVKSFIP